MFSFPVAIKRHVAQHYAFTPGRWSHCRSHLTLSCPVGGGLKKHLKVARVVRFGRRWAYGQVACGWERGTPLVFTCVVASSFVSSMTGYRTRDSRHAVMSSRLRRHRKIKVGPNHNFMWFAWKQFVFGCECRKVNSMLRNVKVNYRTAAHICYTRSKYPTTID